MSDEIYIAKQETLLETKTKVEAVQSMANEILQKPNSGGGQIIFPSLTMFDFTDIGMSISSPSSIDAYFYVTSATTFSGVDEFHHFELDITNSSRHWIYYFDGRPREDVSSYLPRHFYQSAYACCGTPNSKSFHFLGGTFESTRHDRYDVKTRTWTQEANSPYSMTNGIACGEAYDINLKEINTGNYFYFITPTIPVTSRLVKFDDTTKTYTTMINGISSKLRPTMSAKCMIWEYVSASNQRILVCGGNNGGGVVYTDFTICDPSNNTDATFINNPYGTSVTSLCSSCGCLFKEAANGGSLYYFTGSSLTGFPKRDNNLTTVYYYCFFIKNNTIHTLRAGSTFTIPLYRYDVYLPKGTKISSAGNILNKPTMNNVGNTIPYFPKLRIDGDFFVVDKSGVYSYCTLNKVNFNSGIIPGSEYVDIQEGFYIEIGSGE